MNAEKYGKNVKRIRRIAVTNNDQIVASVSAGVERVISSAQWNVGTTQKKQRETPA